MSMSMNRIMRLSNSRTEWFSEMAQKRKYNQKIDCRPYLRTNRSTYLAVWCNFINSKFLKSINYLRGRGGVFFLLCHIITNPKQMNQDSMLHYSQSNVFTLGLFKKHRNEYFDYWSTSLLLFIFLPMHNAAEII